MQNRFDITYHKTATTDKITLSKPLQRHLTQRFHKSLEKTNKKGQMSS